MRAETIRIVPERRLGFVEGLSKPSCGHIHSADMSAADVAHACTTRRSLQ